MASLVLLAVMFGALYFFMIVPQQRRAKAHREMLASLEEGDEVMTSGGIHGVVAEVDGDIIWLEVAPEVELKVLKSAIADKAGTDDDDDETDDDAALVENTDES